MQLTIKQTEALEYLEDDTTEELIFGGGAGGAKSVLGCYWILKNCLKYPATRWLIGRAVLKTLKETTLNTFFEVAAMQGLKGGQHYVYNRNDSSITFFNDSVIILKDLQYYPSDPNFDSLGSLEITGAFIDECNQLTHKAWEIVGSRIRYKLDNYKLKPKMLGTCNPAKNWVYTLFYDKWRKHNLQSDRKFVQALAKDNPFVSRHYIKKLQRLDTVSKERLYFGNWEYDDDPATLISYDKIMDCFTNDFVDYGEKFISADIALQGRDKFVIGNWNGLRCDIAITKSKAEANEVEQDISDIANKHSVPRSNIVVDSDGLGSYLGSYLQGIKTFHGNGKAQKEFSNLRSQCYYKLAEMINSSKIYITCESQEVKDRITKELGAIKRSDIDADDKKKSIISKKHMKELLGFSPDYADMLMMRMIYVIHPNVSGGHTDAIFTR